MIPVMIQIGTGSLITTMTMITTMYGMIAIALSVILAIPIGMIGMTILIRGSSIPKIIKKEAKGWAKSAQKGYFNSGWMLVVRDISTKAIHPEFVTIDRDVKEVVREYNRIGAEEVLEIYDMSKPLPPQLEQALTWEWE